MIEIGEYVRTNEIIGKVEQIGNSLFWLEDGSSYSLTNKEIKHSKNIIDIIEVGDYVNGMPIEDIEEIDNKKVFYSNGEMIAWTNRDKGIETILTKEQYIQNCYKCQYIENGTI